MQSGPSSLIPSDKIKSIYRYLKKFRRDTATIATVPEELLTGNWKAIIVPGEKKHQYFIFSTQQALGAGVQGQVLKAQDIKSLKFAAVKVQPTGSMTFEEDVKQERRNLQICGRLIGCASDKPETYSPGTPYSEYTLMDYYPGDNLIDVLYEQDKSKDADNPARFLRKKELDPFLELRLVIQALDETLFFHKRGLLHRDIKTANFVLDIHGILGNSVTLKLVDAGSALYPAQDKPSRVIVGTFGYNDPAVGQPQHYDVGNDYFSLSIICAEIVTRNNYQKAYREMLQGMIQQQFKRELSAEEISFLLADVFYSPAPPSDKVQDLKIKIREEIIELIKLLVKRPTFAEAEEYSKKLKSLYRTWYIEQRFQSTTSSTELLQFYKSQIGKQPPAGAVTTANPPELTAPAAAIASSPRSVQWQDIKEEKEQASRTGLPKMVEDYHPSKLPRRSSRASSAPANTETSLISHAIDELAALTLEERGPTVLFRPTDSPRKSDSASTSTSSPLPSTPRTESSSDVIPTENQRPSM